MAATGKLGVLLVAVVLKACASVAAPYYGAILGDLSTIHHQVSGRVYAADADTLQILGFTYDGSAPDAFLWIGTSAQPDASGTILPIDPSNPGRKLGRFDNANIIVDLPTGTTISDYKWLSVWCRQFSADFGNLIFPMGFTAPAVHDLGALPTYAHRVRADSVKVLDAKTLRFENLFYDGNGPDAYFWAGTTSSPTRDGIKLIWKPGMPATGTNQRLDRSFNGDTIVVTMPDGMTVYDITYVSLWCVLFRSNFGHVTINPNQLNVPAVLDMAPPFDHCEVLSDNEFHVRWKVEAPNIKVELAGRVEPGNYLAFGLSGSDTRTRMVGSDVTVAWMDQTTMSPMVVDYRLHSRAQCSINNGFGVCPDDLASVGGRNDNVFEKLLSADGIAMFTYSRPLNTGDSTDRVIPTDAPVYISWAIGPINPDGLVAKHVKIPFDNPQINFGRQGTTNCPAFTAVDSGNPLEPWPPSSISNETNFTVDIGQSGGERGYTGITGKVGWGIAWYVNSLLIPEITVQRGTTYTFEVHGGNDPALAAKYHPFYITDDSEGGYVQKTEAEKLGVTIYAGPTEGAYCEWEVRTPGTSPDDYDNFLSYRYYLQRNCVDASPTPGRLTWTPDGSTPDLVYYQCYTHRFLGWKIRVVDQLVTAGTMMPEIPSLPATEDSSQASSTDLGAKPSPTKPSPTDGATRSVTLSAILMVTALLTVMVF
ncbi:protein Skeletor, isoforms B/C-like [Acanthaster planci]|uniref:Protein Skeletor, isoforms B/C-like n=1 Tax=Acanthaster planci TaxID=133434 RepID=A0A8B7XKY5_ACAPL|nr:protein Skeletor, isoforms B/C-like [Acanthaster planci]